jgi:WS/DGAT/MGAT family acyltransferase
MHDHRPDAPPPAGRDEWRPEAPPSSLGMLTRALVGGVLLPLRLGGIAATSIPGLVGHHLPFRRNSSADLIDEDLKLPGMRVPRTRFSGLVSPHRVTELRTWPQEELRRIKAQVPGATVNDTALVIVGGALRLYLAAKNELPDQSLTTMLPVSTRTATEATSGGNSISFIRIPLHTDIADPIERLEAIHRMTRHAKLVNKGVPAQVLNRISDELPGMLLGIGQRASAQIAYRLGQAILANTTVTNVPGPREVLYFCGAKMSAQYGMGPLANGLGLLHIFSSYAGKFMLSITADRAMMPDPHFYGECLDDSYAGLAKGATTAPIAARGDATRTTA